VRFCGGGLSSKPVTLPELSLSSRLSLSSKLTNFLLRCGEEPSRRDFRGVPSSRILGGFRGGIDGWKTVLL